MEQEILARRLDRRGGDLRGVDDDVVGEEVGEDDEPARGLDAEPGGPGAREVSIAGSPFLSLSVAAAPPPWISIAMAPFESSVTAILSSRTTPLTAIRARAAVAE